MLAESPAGSDEGLAVVAVIDFRRGALLARWVSGGERSGWGPSGRSDDGSVPGPGLAMMGRWRYVSV